MAEMANWLGTPEAYATPNQQKAAQEYASALLKHSMGPIYANSFKKALPQGLAHMTEALVGGLDTYRGGQRERRAMEQAAKTYPNEMTDPALAGRRAGMEAPSAPMAAGSPTAPPPMPPAGPRLAGPMPTPDTLPPTPPGAKTGDAFGGMPGWAPGERPIDMGDAPTAPPAGPRLAGGPMPYGPSETGAPAPMAKALAGTPAGGGKPALGVTNGPDPSVAQGPIPPGLMPSPPMMGRKQFEAAMSNPWIPQQHKDAIMGMYYGQGQPIQTQDAAGNTIFANPRNPAQQRRVWGVQGAPVKGKDVEFKEEYVRDIDPMTGLPKQRVLPREEPGGGAMPATAPVAPQGPKPPSMEDKIPGLNFAPTEAGPPGVTDWLRNPEGPMRGPPGQSDLPFSGGSKLAGPAPTPDTTDGQGGPVRFAGAVPQRLEEMTNWGNQKAFEQARRTKEMEADKTALQKDYENIASGGESSVRLLDDMKLARQFVDDPRFYSGPGAHLVLPFEQLMSKLKGEDPNRAVPMEAFRKLMSNATLTELRSKLQGLGQVRVAEIDLLNKALPSLDNTQGGNRMVIELLERAHRQQSFLTDIANQYKAGTRWDDKGKPYQVDPDTSTSTGLHTTLKRWAEKTAMSDAERDRYAAQIKPPPETVTEPVFPRAGRNRAPASVPGAVLPSLPPGVTLDK